MDSQITFIEYCIHCYNKVNPESLHLPKINTMASKMSLADAIEKVADSEDSCSDWKMSEDDLVEGEDEGNLECHLLLSGRPGSALSRFLLSPVSHSGFPAIQALQESQQLT